MLEGGWNQLQHLLGVGREVANINAGQMALRAIVIYTCTLAIVRMGSKRFLGKETPMDVVVGIMLGS